MSKKNKVAKKNKNNLKVLAKNNSTGSEEAVVKELPNYKTEEYLALKKKKELYLEQEREKYKKLKEEEKSQRKIEEENIKKAQELIEQHKKESEQANSTPQYEQPEVVKEISLFDNYNDKKMAYRKEEIERTNRLKDDFRVKKYLQVNKLPVKPRTAKLETPEQVATMIVSSKKEINERSGKNKAIKKAKLSKEDKKELEKLFLLRAEQEAQMIKMFQPKGAKIPMYEVYWSVQNTIVSLQKLYKENKNPFQEISEFDFCDSLVWSARYLIEMLYTEEYPLEFLKKDCLEFSEKMYGVYNLQKGSVNAIDAERASLELREQLITSYKYSSMVVNY